MVCCVFSLESPRRGDSNEYTQYTIFNVKTKITPNYSTSALMPRVFWKIEIYLVSFSLRYKSVYGGIYQISHVYHYGIVKTEQNSQTSNKRSSKQKRSSMLLHVVIVWLKKLKYIESLKSHLGWVLWVLSESSLIVIQIWRSVKWNFRLY